MREREREMFAMRMIALLPTLPKSGKMRYTRNEVWGLVWDKQDIFADHSLNSHSLILKMYD